MERRKALLSTLGLMGAACFGVMPEDPKGGFSNFTEFCIEQKRKADKEEIPIEHETLYGLNVIPVENYGCTNIVFNDFTGVPANAEAFEKNFDEFWIRQLKESKDYPLSL